RPSLGHLHVKVAEGDGVAVEVDNNEAKVLEPLGVGFGNDTFGGGLAEPDRRLLDDPHLGAGAELHLLPPLPRPARNTMTSMTAISTKAIAPSISPPPAGRASLRRSPPPARRRPQSGPARG